MTPDYINIGHGCWLKNGVVYSKAATPGSTSTAIKAGYDQMAEWLTVTLGDHWTIDYEEDRRVWVLGVTGLNAAFYAGATSSNAVRAAVQGTWDRIEARRKTATNRRAPTLVRLAEQATTNSRRWFPELAARTPREQLLHQTLGLFGEAGEVANLIKKMNRTPLGEEVHEPDGLRDELADVFTYLLNIAHMFGINLEEVFQTKQAICETRWGDPTNEGTEQ
jgi:NTP pyrophosphatase (non-canonical NTP hydrolase)